MQNTAYKAIRFSLLGFLILLFQLPTVQGSQAHPALLDWVTESPYRALNGEVTAHSSADKPIDPAVLIQKLALQGNNDPTPFFRSRLQAAFDHYTIEQGLSQSSVYAVMQDHLGFIWIGTEDGLNRFDGYNFTVFRNDPEDPDSLNNSYVRAIYEDSSGVLWIGTYGGGLNRFDRDAEQFSSYHHDPQNPNSLSDNQVLSLYEDRAGNLWIGTRKGGLDRFDRQKEEFIHYRNVPGRADSLSSEEVNAMLEDSQGVFWVATAAGLDRLNRGTGQVIHFQSNRTAPHGLSSDSIQTLFEDHSGALWVGTSSNGLFRISPDRDQLVNYVTATFDKNSLSNNTVNSIWQDALGDLWVGTGDGLNRYDPEKQGFIHYRRSPTDPRSLTNNNIIAISEDQSGGLWIGTYGGGLNRYDRQGEKFTLIQSDPDNPNSLSENAIWSIYEDRFGIFWVGTDGGGLNRYDRDEQQWRHFVNYPGIPGTLSNNSVVAIYEDQAGVLWVGTWGGGLNRFDRENESFYHYKYDPGNPQSLSNNVVWSIFEDHDGELWIGTSSGLNRFDRDTGKFKRYFHDPNDPHSLSDNAIGPIYQDSSEVLWVATHNGLDRYDPQTDSFIAYQNDPEDPKSISHNIVFSIHEDRNQNLWMGTWGGGLNEFNREDETFRHYRTKDGLPNDSIYGILEDDAGNLWLSTNHGISKFNPQAETFKNFDVGDGLQSNEFNYNAYFEDSSGQMFFGGINGLNVFYPDQVRDNPYIPSIVLTSLTHGGQPFELGTATEGITELTLRWPIDQIEFEFAALSFFQPNKNQYAYKLEGLDSDWNDISTRRFGGYTNLPGGTYTLLLRGSNNDGMWNEAGLALKISVLPPLWRTLWFQGLLALLVLATVTGGIRLRIRGVEARNRELEALVEARTQAIKQRNYEIEQRRQELEALYRAGEIMSRHLVMDRVLQALVDVAVDILRADKSAVIMWNEHRDRLIMRVARGFSSEAVGQLTFSAGEGMVGQVADSGEPLFVEDMRSDPRLEGEDLQKMEIIIAEGIRTAMFFPINSGKGTLGVFNVDFTQPYVIGEDEKRLFQSLAQRAALHIEHARLFKAEQRRVEQFQVISEVGHRITSISTVDHLLHQIVRLVQQTFGYYHVAIGLIEGDEVVYRVGSGTLWDDPEFGFKPARLKVGKEGITGWVAASGQPLLVSDVTREPHYVWMQGSQCRSELTVPIMVKGKVLGVLDVQSDQLGAFDEADLEMIQSLANQAAVALENARLFENAQQLAVIEERTRLARDLHDSAKQKAFAALAQLGTAIGLIKRDPEEVPPHLIEAESLVHDVLQELTILIQEMHPFSLKERGLTNLLREYIFDWTNQANIEVALQIDGDRRLPLDVEQVIYRIVQESLANVSRHSQARNVKVCLSYEDETVRLSVRDDGCGFDPQNTHMGLGLHSMRERAERLNGNLQIESAVGEGTCVSLRLVVPANT